jgi:hypothetical protein
MEAAMNEEWAMQFGTLDGSTSKHTRLPQSPVVVDCEVISDILTHHMVYRWGRRFYGDTLPPRFSTNLIIVPNYSAAVRIENGEEDDEEVTEELLRDIYDSAASESYGALIDPLKFATAVNEASRPRSQNCSVCSDVFGLQTAQSPSLKLRECGHYFHDGCIRDWLKSVHPNSNLCPECRTQICEERRLVRVAGAPPPYRRNIETSCRNSSRHCSI